MTSYQKLSSTDHTVCHRFITLIPDYRKKKKKKSVSIVDTISDLYGMTLVSLKRCTINKTKKNYISHTNVLQHLTQRRSKNKKSINNQMKSMIWYDQTIGQRHLAKAALHDPHTWHVAYTALTAADLSHVTDRQTPRTSATIVCISCIRCNLKIVRCVTRDIRQSMQKATAMNIILLTNIGMACFQTLSKPVSQVHNCRSTLKFQKI